MDALLFYKWDSFFFYLIRLKDSLSELKPLRAFSVLSKILPALCRESEIIPI